MDSMRAMLRRPSRPSQAGARLCWMAWRKSSRTDWWPRKSLTTAEEALWFSSRAADTAAGAGGFWGLGGEVGAWSGKEVPSGPEILTRGGASGEGAGGGGEKGPGAAAGSV